MGGSLLLSPTDKQINIYMLSFFFFSPTGWGFWLLLVLYLYFVFDNTLITIPVV